MKNSLDNKFLAKKKAKKLYKFLLSKGESEKAKKINEFYDLQEDFKKNISHIYFSYLSIGDIEKASDFLDKYNIKREIEEDLEKIKGAKFNTMQNKIYNYFARKMGAYHSKMKNSFNLEDKLIFHNKRQKNYTYMNYLVDNVNLNRKPQADFKTLLNDFKNYYVVIEMYATKDKIIKEQASGNQEIRYAA